MKHSPPRLFLRFFQWFCHPRLRDHVEGDLIEVFNERLGMLEKRGADRKFVIDVILGMGRVVGDGAIYLHIQDVIVRPEYQRRGIGKMIMEKLMTFVNGTGGNYTNIGLMCSKGREPFYKNFGFIERPSGKFGAGMIMVRE